MFPIQKEYNFLFIIKIQTKNIAMKILFFELYFHSYIFIINLYYFLTYSNPNVPPLLRTGANRAFHEAIGSMMGMAAMQKPYLEGRGLISSTQKTDSIQMLLT